eukprot:scaffold6507_cov90-Cylindrotheca_fusiformis.AAC.3
MQSRRTDLNCVDWFCDGPLTLFDIDGHGRIVVKPFGYKGPFQLLGPTQRPKRMAFLVEPVLAYLDKDELFGGWCNGEENAETTISELVESTVECSWEKKDLMFLGLENEINPPIPRHAHRIAHVYSDALWSEKNGLSEMQVLGHGEFAVNLGPESSASSNRRAAKPTAVENMSPKWNNLFNHLRSLNLAEVGGGEIHEATEGSEMTMSMYNGHIDKRVFPEACFLPLTGNFWTFVAIPKTVTYKFEDQSDSSREFRIWAKLLSASDRTRVFSFLGRFRKRAEEMMKEEIDSRGFFL